MLVAVGVGIVQIVQGVVIYNQSNTISKLEAENKNWPERFDKGLKEVAEEKQEIIDAMKAEKQELVTKNDALIKANQELSKKNEDSIRKSDEMISRMDAILGIPGIQASVQVWQEAGDMYRSNISEPHSEPSTVKTSEEEGSCTETASVAESEESDIEIIDRIPPSTSMNGLTLSHSASNQR
ncbi:hypothetical protein [Wolbachia endosymbiont of Folsomia candida]|uniref:hypothetical protein n=1 Tax=Wolbachia endosymbiont of Folsomia candida TaxID=169402 RepID=UPI000AF3028D|nr:hypothetical protein [Wolbachia endosymbiont of Folsomia candida]APR98026.1 hypothetical protein ASM33_01755 [Wolbachia endosymbiont of Folsomia candida]